MVRHSVWGASDSCSGPSKGGYWKQGNTRVSAGVAAPSAPLGPRILFEWSESHPKSRSINKKDDT
jgi:hypothetical protein